MKQITEAATVLNILLRLANDCTGGLHTHFRCGFDLCMGLVGERGRPDEANRDRQTERQTDGWTDRQTQRQADRQTTMIVCYNS